VATLLDNVAAGTLGVVLSSAACVRLMISIATMQSPDPWGVSRATFSDRVLRRHLARFIRNKSVLDALR